MKKILSLLTVATLSIGGTTSVISCSSKEKPPKPPKPSGTDISKLKLTAFTLKVNSTDKFKDQNELERTLGSIKKNIANQIGTLLNKTVYWPSDLTFSNLNEFKLNESLNKTFNVKFSGNPSGSRNKLTGENNVNVSFSSKTSINGKILPSLKVKVSNKANVTKAEQQNILSQLWPWITSKLKTLTTFDLTLDTDYTASGFSIGDTPKNMTNPITETITSVDSSNYIYGVATMQIIAE